MIIVLKPHTSEENIHRVENLVKKHGLDTCLLYTSQCRENSQEQKLLYKLF